MQADIPIPRAHDLTGAVLGGRYEVLGKLGMGGMAAVYEGRRLGLHNRVAIKVLKEELCEDPGNVKRFLREARAASVIEHENIVQIIDFGPVDGTPVYFVMEFLEGSDLRRVIKQVGPLPWSQAQSVLLQVVSALAAAHDKGIVHRDVKPANIYLVPKANTQPRVKVLDFGIAKVVEEGRGGITRGLTMTNGLLGTVAYMAPEQARGGKIDARTDIYALGVVAYQAMTGTVPFTGNNPFMVLERHVNEMPRPPRELVPTIPPGVDEIILRCMAKRPEDRFQSMPEVAEALQRVPAIGMPSMGVPAPVVEVTSGTEAWPQPPVLEVPSAEPPRVAATERLGSGSAKVLAGSGTARTPLAWAPQTGVTSTTPASASSTGTARLEDTTHTTVKTGAPNRAFFALGLGLGLVAACAIAFFVIDHYRGTTDERAVAGEHEAPPPVEVETPAMPPAKAATKVETPEVETPEVETPEVETPEVETPEVADTAVAESAGEEPTHAQTHRTGAKKKRRDIANTKTETRDPPPNTKETKRETKESTSDIHPDLREPYK